MYIFILNLSEFFLRPSSLWIMIVAFNFYSILFLYSINAHYTAQCIRIIFVAARYMQQTNVTERNSIIKFSNSVINYRTTESGSYWVFQCIIIQLRKTAVSGKILFASASGYETCAHRFVSPVNVHRTTQGIYNGKEYNIIIVRVQRLNWKTPMMPPI